MLNLVDEPTFCGRQNMMLGASSTSGFSVIVCTASGGRFTSVDANEKLHRVSNQITPIRLLNNSMWKQFIEVKERRSRNGGTVSIHKKVNMSRANPV